MGTRQPSTLGSGVPMSIITIATTKGGVIPTRYFG